MKPKNSDRLNIKMKWIAHFNDNSNKFTIKQFDDKGNEIKYKEVIDNIDNLSLFVLIDNDGNTYSVNLKTNEFYYNEDLLFDSRVTNPKFTYYRKCRLNFGEKMPFVIECMGFENNDGEYCLIEIDIQNKLYRFSYS